MSTLGSRGVRSIALLLLHMVVRMCAGNLECRECALNIVERPCSARVTIATESGPIVRRPGRLAPDRPSGGGTVCLLLLLGLLPEVLVFVIRGSLLLIFRLVLIRVLIFIHMLRDLGGTGGLWMVVGVGCLKGSRSLEACVCNFSVAADARTICQRNVAPDARCCWRWGRPMCMRMRRKAVIFNGLWDLWRGRIRRRLRKHQHEDE